MNPFVIHCQSCEAKLKVAKTSLLGKTIACPRCKSPVTVALPGSDVADASKAHSPSVESGASGAFDDIEAILQTTQATEAPASGKPSPATRPLTQKIDPQGTARPTNAVADSTDAANRPILPSSAWSSDAARRRQRIAQMIALAIFVPVAIAAIVFWLMQENDRAPGVEVTQTPVETPIAPPVPTPDDGEPAVDAVGELADQPAPPVVGPMDKPVTSGDPASADPTLADPLAEITASPPPEVLAPEATPEKQADAPNSFSLADRTIAATDAASRTQSAGGLENTDQSPLQTEGTESLGELANMLQQSGASLNDIQDIALLERESTLVGLPKYYVAKPDFEVADVQREMAVEVAQIEFRDASLLDALMTIEDLSNVPHVFDWRSAAFRDAELDLRVTLNAESRTVRQWIETLVSPVGLSLEPAPPVLQFGDSRSSTVAERTIPHQLELDASSLKRLENLIVATVGPETWDEANATTVSVTAENIVARNRPEFLDTIQTLITRLEGIAQVDGKEPLISVPTCLQADDLLAAAPKLLEQNAFRQPLRLTRMLQRVRRQTGLRTFIQWDRLYAEGWTLQTQVPGNVDEPDNRALLKQISRSMNLTWRVIDDRSVLLTTFEHAAAVGDVEVYPVASVLNETITPQRLGRVLSEALGGQLNSPNVTVIYFGELQCVVASAPQSFQRQLHSVLVQMEK